MAKKPDISQKLIDAAFDLATTQRWSDLNMTTIASHAKVPLTQALEIYANKAALLDGVMQRVDTAALNESSGFGEYDSIKDKLFALLMARLDALAPHRAAIGAIVCDTLKHPMRAMCRLPRFMQSMALMLETAGVSTSGPAGMVKINGLAVVFLNTLRVWLKDDTEDQGASMAALDLGLRRVDGMACKLCSVRPSPEAAQ